MTKDAALTLALAWLESGTFVYPTTLSIAIKEALAQPEQGPKYRCCPHDSDCAVHNMPAYPAGPCDCTYKDTFNTPPSAEIYDVCLALATRELDRLIHCNFGQTPREAWADKVLNVYHFFDSNPKAKSLSDQYMLSPQRPCVGLTDEEIKILWIQYRAALPRYLCFANAVLAKSKELNT